MFYHLKELKKEVDLFGHFKEIAVISTGDNFNPFKICDNPEPPPNIVIFFIYHHQS